MAIERHPLPAMPDPRDALAVQREAALSELLLARSESSAPAEDRIDLKTLWRALARHRRLILGVTALFTLAAGLYTLRTTPQYESTVMLQIDRAAQKVVGFNAEVEVDEGPAADQMQLRTQIELLKSRSLAERVIDEMGLYKPESPTGLPEAPAAEPGRLPGEAEADAEAPGFVALLGNNLKMLFTASSEDERVLGRAETIKEFEKSVTVEPIRNSRLVEVRVLNADPHIEIVEWRFGDIEI